MIRYLIAFGLFGMAMLAYTILAFGARFNRPYQRRRDGKAEGAVSDRIKGQRHTHFGGPR